MGRHLRTSHFIYEVGTSDFLISFFDTIEVRLTRGFFGKKFPVVLGDFYNGEIPVENLELAKNELIEIQKRLKKFKPSKIVWDKNDRSKRPPWGEDISSEITDLSNYFVTSDGRDLFGVIFRALDTAIEENCELRIE